MSDQHATSPAVEHATHEAGHPYVNYWIIFGALCVLTVVSWMADEIGNKGLVLTLVVLSVASFKALFVMMYFMHLKFEGKWKFVLLAPTMVLALAIPAALMPDIGSHYYDYQVPQLADDADAGHTAAPAGKHEVQPAGKHDVPRAGNHDVPRAGNHDVPRAGNHDVPRAGNHDTAPKHD